MVLQPDYQQLFASGGIDAVMGAMKPPSAPAPQPPSVPGGPGFRPPAPYQPPQPRRPVMGPGGPIGRPGGSLLDDIRRRAQEQFSTGGLDAGQVAGDVPAG